MLRKIGINRYSSELPLICGRTCLSLLLTLCLSLGAVDFISDSFGGVVSQALSPEEEFFHTPDFSSLNVRLHAKSMTPPVHMVKRTVLLKNLQEGLPVAGNEIRSAIIEDDARRQVLVLSTQGTVESNEPLQVYLLYDFDFESRIPVLRQCAQERQCAQGARDQQPGTGGLACIAICMVHALHPPTS